MVQKILFYVDIFIFLERCFTTIFSIFVSVKSKIMTFTNIKMRLIIAVMLTIATSLSAQNKIKYSYDAAGNRTKKEIVIEPDKTPENKLNSPINRNKNGFSDRYKTEIHADNERKRIVTSIKGITTGDKCHIEMLSTNGALIMRYNTKNGNAVIDMTNMQDGIYLLKITINRETNTWKIIIK